MSFQLQKSNEMFSFELKVSSDVTNSNTPVLFDVIISRIDSFQVRHDSQVLGKWQLYTKTQNGISQNISQYPVDYIFSKDNSYSKTIYNTVDNTQYSIGGAWSLSQANTLSLVEKNTTKTIFLKYLSFELLKVITNIKINKAQIK